MKKIKFILFAFTALLVASLLSISIKAETTLGTHTLLVSDLWNGTSTDKVNPIQNSFDIFTISSSTKTFVISDLPSKQTVNDKECTLYALAGGARTINVSIDAGQICDIYLYIYVYNPDKTITIGDNSYYLKDLGYAKESYQVLEATGIDETDVEINLTTNVAFYAISVNVYNYACESIEISGDSAEMAMGESSTLTAILNNGNPCTDTVTWQASNDNVVLNPSDDNLTCEVFAAKSGNTIITAKAGNKSATVEINILESEVYNITFNVDGNQYATSSAFKETGKVAYWPDQPKKNHYSFIGWYLSDQKVDENTIFTQDEVLEAKFEHLTIELVAFQDYLTEFKQLPVDSQGKTTEIYTLMDGIEFSAGAQSSNSSKTFGDGTNLESYIQSQSIDLTIGHSGMLTIYATQTGSTTNPPRNVDIIDENGHIVASYVPDLKVNDAKEIITVTLQPGKYKLVSRIDGVETGSMNWYGLKFDIVNIFQTKLKQYMNGTQTSIRYVSSIFGVTSEELANLNVTLRLTLGDQTKDVDVNCVYSSITNDPEYPQIEGVYYMVYTITDLDQIQEYFGQNLTAQVIISHNNNVAQSSIVAIQIPMFEV